MEYFDDRRRAESFGEVASDYDAYRPQYPAELIAAIMQAATAVAESRTQASSNTATGSGTVAGTDACPEARVVTGTGPDASVPRILDVGSGTGILASQLREAGAKILAVEPDAEMAAVARAKGLEVEVSSFEGWDRRGRTFDLVSFGQSFHWVDPMIALPRIRTLLAPGGSLALAWNDIEARGELRTRLAAVAAKYHAEGSTASLGTAAEDRFASVEHPALTQLRATGFSAHESTFVEELRYSRDDWLSMVFTYSAQLTMDPVKRAIMREDMVFRDPCRWPRRRQLSPAHPRRALSIPHRRAHTADPTHRLCSSRPRPSANAQPGCQPSRGHSDRWGGAEPTVLCHPASR